MQWLERCRSSRRARVPPVHLAQALSNASDVPGAEKLVNEGLKEIPDDTRFALERVFCLQRGSLVALKRGDPHEAMTRARLPSCTGLDSGVGSPRTQSVRTT